MDLTIKYKQEMPITLQNILKSRNNKICVKTMK